MKKNVPSTVSRKLKGTHLDLSILTGDPQKAEGLMDELVEEFFGEVMLRLRRSSLPGMFPGGMILYEDNVMRDFHDGISIFHASLKELEHRLALHRDQINPTLLRYVNRTPPLSHSVEIYHLDKQMLALPLSEDAIVEVEGSLGSMSLAVANGHFHVKSSTCRHGICLAHPPMIAPGQRITCVPNNVTAVIGPPLR